MNKHCRGNIHLMVLYINTKDQKVVWVALKKEGKVIKKLRIENEYGSQVLLPFITKLIRAQKLELSDLTEIQVDTGPGSYTGLRVGASVAQALGFALNIPVNGKLNKPINLQYT